MLLMYLGWWDLRAPRSNTTTHRHLHSPDLAATPLPDGPGPALPTATQLPGNRAAAVSAVSRCGTSAGERERGMFHGAAHRAEGSGAKPMMTQASRAPALLVVLEVLSSVLGSL